MTQKNATFVSIAASVTASVLLILLLDLLTWDMAFTWNLHGAGLAALHVLRALVIVGAVIACLFAGDRLENKLWMRSAEEFKRSGRYMSGYDGQQHKD